MDVSFEPFRLAHLGAVARLFHRQLPPVSWREVAYHLSRRKGIRVAMTEGKVVGFYLAVWASGNEGLWLDYIAVDTARVKTGIGRKLVGDLERSASGVGFPIIQLSANIGNFVAIRFYEREGYQSSTITSDPTRIIFGKKLAPELRFREQDAKEMFGSFEACGRSHRLALMARRLLMTAWILVVSRNASTKRVT